MRAGDDTAARSGANPIGTGLLRSNLVVATGTALSRLTGLIRVVVFGIIIGQAGLADAYDGANNSPNAIYELLLGGVLSASLVPLFSKQAEQGDDEGTSAVITVAVMFFTAITVVAVAAAPLIFRLFSLSPSSEVDAAQYREVGTLLARIFLVQIFFYGITALAGAALNARRRYFAAAWTPVLANLITIAALLLVPSIMDGRRPELVDVLTSHRLRWTLGLGATLGIAVMGITLMLALRAAQVPMRPNFDVRHPAVRRLLAMSGWTLGYVAANQVAVIVVKNLADPGSGQQTAYTMAYTFFVLPYGLLAVSIATTFEPEMARNVARRNKADFIDRASLGLRLIALLTIPAGFGLFVLRRSIIGAVLVHGNFDATNALDTSRALAGFALGLGAFSIYLFVLRGFYAHHDARTPFIINLVENALNIVFAFILMPRFGVLGLGLSFALAYLVSALWAMHVLATKVPGFELRPLFASLGRIVLASVVMAEAVWATAQVIGANDGAMAVMRVVAGVAVGIVVYIGVLVALGTPELWQLQERLPGLRSLRLRRAAPDHPDG